MTALQVLPQRHVAVLILRDVLGFHASDVAEMLDVTVDSVNSAFKEPAPASSAGSSRPPGHLPTTRSWPGTTCSACGAHSHSRSRRRDGSAGRRAGVPGITETWWPYDGDFWHPGVFWHNNA